ncbi:hypothetical protein H8356DRAFT_1278632 [Neocallimastix lanati (nom. inval.)]|nr:hypothetical protein H8356DRAFT_1278632 [Neocallimastix sp. JGI-2020a]
MKILNKYLEILKYESLHKHFEKKKKEFDATRLIAKHKIKDKIGKSSIPLGIKSNRIFNGVSQEMDLILLGRSDKINSLIEKYRTMLSKFIDNGRFRNDIVELWFKCLINLNIINTDF